MNEVSSNQSMQRRKYHSLHTCIRITFCYFQTPDTVSTNQWSVHMTVKSQRP